MNNMTNNYFARKKVRKFFLFLSLAIISFIFLAPLIIMVSTSLKPETEVFSVHYSIFPRQPRIQNYSDAMKAGDWGLYFWNSFVITAITVLLSLIFNSMAGYAFSRLKFKGRNACFLLSLIGMMVPAQVTMVPLFIIVKNFPLVGGNNILGSGGTGFLNSIWGMILPYAAGAFGVFMFRQFYMNFPTALDDAARVDGLGGIRTFIYIYLPMSGPVFATLAVMKATQTWSEYTWPLIITQDKNMMTVQLALEMFKSAELGTQWHLLMAATTLVSLPLIFLFVCAQKFFVKGITTSGLK